MVIEWKAFKDDKPKPGARIIAHDGRTWGLYTTMKPSKDVTMKECLDHLHTLIEVYGLIEWYIPEIPKNIK